MPSPKLRPEDDSEILEPVHLLFLIKLFQASDEKPFKTTSHAGSRYPHKALVAAGLLKRTELNENTGELSFTEKGLTEITQLKELGALQLTATPPASLAILGELVQLDAPVLPAELIASLKLPRDVVWDALNGLHNKGQGGLATKGHVQGSGYYFKVNERGKALFARLHTLPTPE